MHRPHTLPAVTPQAAQQLQEGVLASCPLVFAGDETEAQRVSAHYSGSHSC